MTALLVPNVGEVRLLGWAVNNVAQDDLTLKLYTNDYTPVEASTNANFTESVAAGYASVTLTKGSWVITTVAGTTTATYAQQTFTFTAAGTSCYGYWIEDEDSTLIWAEKFGGAEPVYDGKILKVTPRIELA